MFSVRRRNAFTLVELLVVVGIIAMLIGILMPALQKARMAAYDVVSASNVRQFGIALQIYVDQNKGVLPQKGPDGSKPTQAFGPIGNGNGVVGYDDPSIWFNALPPLVNGKSYYQMLVDDYKGVQALPKPGDKNIFICPLAAQCETINGNDILDPSGSYYLLYGTDSTGTILNSTGMNTAKQFKFAMSYVFNSKLTSSITQSDPPLIKMSTLRYGAETVVMTEKISNYGEYQDPGVQKWSNANPSVYLNTGKISTYGCNENVAQPKSDWTRFAARHHGGGFLLFADGHVKWYAWPDVQYPQSQLPYTTNSDANHYGTVRWSAMGAVN
jgi:prepilin-type N-terminal cleavage/methylation domain-containing protein